VSRADLLGRRQAAAVLERQAEAANTKLAYDETTAAKLLSLSPRKMYLLRATRQISYSRAGTRIIYSVDHLKAFLQKNEVPALSDANVGVGPVEVSACGVPARTLRKAEENGNWNPPPTEQV